MAQTRRDPQRPPTGVVVFTATLAMTAGMFLQSALSVIGPFLRDSLGVSRTQLGLLFFTLSVAGALMAPMTGRRADRSIRGSLRWLYVFSALGLLLVAGAPNLGWALAAAVVGAVGLAATNPVSNKLVSWSVPPRHRGLALGIKQSGPFFAMILAGLVLPSLAGWIGWRAAVAVTAALPIAALASTWLSGFGGEPTGVGPTPGGTAPARTDPDVWWLAGAGLLVATGTGVCIAFIPLYGEEVLGFPASVAGLAASLFGLVGVAGRVGWGAAAERWRNPSMFLILLAGAGVLAGLMILGGRVTPWSYWSGVVVGGASILAWHAVVWLTVLQTVEHGRIGLASGIIHRANMIGVASGPPIAGFLTDRTGNYDSAWISVSVFLVAATVVMMIWRRRGASTRSV